MTQSLLTDQENADSNSIDTFTHLKVSGVEGGLAMIAARFRDALIAARAENKRLRGGLLAIANADFDKVLELVGAPFVSSGDKYKSAEDFETAGDYSTDARYIRPARERAISAAARALLQSEKGGAE